MGDLTRRDLTTLPDGGSFACDADGTQYMSTRVFVGSPATPTAQQGVELLRSLAV